MLWGLLEGLIFGGASAKLVTGGMQFRRQQEAIRRGANYESTWLSSRPIDTPGRHRPIDQPRTSHTTYTPQQFHERTSRSYRTADGWDVQHEGFFTRRRH